MTILHLGHPTLNGGLLIVSAQQQLGGVPALHILQHPNPVVHRGIRIGRQIVHLLAGVDFKRGSTLGANYPAQIVEHDLALWFSIWQRQYNKCKAQSYADNLLPIHVVLTFPVGQTAVLQHKPSLSPCLQFATQFSQMSNLRNAISTILTICKKISEKSSNLFQRLHFLVGRIGVRRAHQQRRHRGVHAGRLRLGQSVRRNGVVVGHA